MPDRSSQPCSRASENPASFFRGLLYGLPISALLWAGIIMAVVR